MFSILDALSGAPSWEPRSVCEVWLSWFAYLAKTEPGKHPRSLSFFVESKKWPRYATLFTSKPKWVLVLVVVLCFNSNRSGGV